MDTLEQPFLKLSLAPVGLGMGAHLDNQAVLTLFTPHDKFGFKVLPHKASENGSLLSVMSCMRPAVVKVEHS